MNTKELLTEVYWKIGFTDYELIETLAGHLILPQIKGNEVIIRGFQELKKITSKSTLSLPEGVKSKKPHTYYSPFLFFLDLELNTTHKTKINLKKVRHIVEQCIAYIHHLINKKVEKNDQEDLLKVLGQNKSNKISTEINILRRAISKFVELCKLANLHIPHKLMEDHKENILPHLSPTKADKSTIKSICKIIDLTVSKRRGKESQGRKTQSYTPSKELTSKINEFKRVNGVGEFVPDELPEPGSSSKNYIASFSHEFNKGQELDIDLMAYMMDAEEAKHGTTSRKYLETLLTIGIECFEKNINEGEAKREFWGNTLTISSIGFNSASKNLQRNQNESIFTTKSNNIKFELDFAVPDDFNFERFSHLKGKLKNFCAKHFSCPVLQPLFYNLNDSWTHYQSLSREFINALLQHHYEKLKEFGIVKALKNPPKVMSTGKYYGGIGSNPNCFDIDTLKELYPSNNPRLQLLKHMTMSALRGEKDTPLIKFPSMRNSHNLILEKEMLRVGCLENQGIDIIESAISQKHISGEDIPTGKISQFLEQSNDPRLLAPSIIANYYSLKTKDFVNTLHYSNIALGHSSYFRHRSDLNSIAEAQKVRAIFNDFFGDQ